MPTGRKTSTQTHCLQYGLIVILLLVHTFNNYAQNLAHSAFHMTTANSYTRKPAYLCLTTVLTMTRRLFYYVYTRAVARLRQRRRLPPLILGQDSKNSRMQENTVAVRILRIGQQIWPPPFLRSGYGPVHISLLAKRVMKKDVILSGEHKH